MNRASKLRLSFVVSMEAPQGTSSRELRKWLQNSLAKIASEPLDLADSAEGLSSRPDARTIRVGFKAEIESIEPKKGIEP